MDELDEKIHNIKLFRNPNYFLDILFTDLIKYKHPDKINIIFYIKDKELIFYYDVNYNYIYYNKDIFFILRKKYKCDEEKMSFLIKEKFYSFFQKFVVIYKYWDMNDDFIDNLVLYDSI